MIMPTLDSEEDDETTSFASIATERTAPIIESKSDTTNSPSPYAQQSIISTPVRRMGKFSTFIMDSGCTAHVTNEAGILHEIRLSQI